jgi:hypothetical protein
MGAPFGIRLRPQAMASGRRQTKPMEWVLPEPRLEADGLMLRPGTDPETLVADRRSARRSQLASAS